jgi:hypothetical protein
LPLLKFAGFAGFKDGNLAAHCSFGRKQKLRKTSAKIRKHNPQNTLQKIEFEFHELAQQLLPHEIIAITFRQSACLTLME